MLSIRFAPSVGLYWSERCESLVWRDVQAMGIYRTIESTRDITTSTIIKRIWANHESYMVSDTLLVKNWVGRPCLSCNRLDLQATLGCAFRALVMRCVSLCDQESLCSGLPVQARNEKKQKSEAAYLANKAYVTES